MKTPGSVGFGPNTSKTLLLSPRTTAEHLVDVYLPKRQRSAWPTGMHVNRYPKNFLLSGD